MKWFHTVVVSVFIKPEENYSLVKEKFIEIFPFSLDDNKVKIDETSATFDLRTLKIVELKLTKESLIKQLLDSILTFLDQDDIDMMIRQINTRVDADSNFFFRLSKSKMVSEDRYVIVDDGDCYHFKCHVAAYPQNQSVAIETAKNFLTSKLE